MEITSPSRMLVTTNNTKWHHNPDHNKEAWKSFDTVGTWTWSYWRVAAALRFPQINRYGVSESSLDTVFCQGKQMWSMWYTLEYIFQNTTFLFHIQNLSDVSLLQTLHTADCTTSHTTDIALHKSEILFPLLPLFCNLLCFFCIEKYFT
jgi:hypothetical protein